MEDLRGGLSPVALDHCRNPRNAGEYAQPDGCGLASRSCGDTLQFCLRVREGRIAGARFMTNGCGPTVACGSVTTEMVKGKTIADALAINEEDILKALEGLPESEVHCATLAADALRQAIRDYLSLQREPWKRSYRRVEPISWGRPAGSD